jgi:hypothetical protein
VVINLHLRGSRHGTRSPQDLYPVYTATAGEVHSEISWRWVKSILAVPKRGAPSHRDADAVLRGLKRHS